MKKIDQETLRKAQLRMLDILLEVDRICKKNNIDYWLSDGTFLGAVRHQGFIPWDDDIDIAMTIENYNKFIEIAEKELNSEKFFLFTKISQKKAKVTFIKVKDRTSLALEKGEEPTPYYHQGLFIDIFPMEFIKNIPQKIYKPLIKVRRKLKENNKHESYIDILNYLKINNIIEKILIGKDKNNATFVGYKYKWFQLFKIQDIFPLQEIEFEGYKFPCPNNADSYLRALYGDTYMQFPPEKDRIGHFSEVNLNKKCEYEKSLKK